jgi:hypothetical protein
MNGLHGPPAADEYGAAFAGYVARIGAHEDILAVMAAQLDQDIARLGAVPDVRGDYRYAPGKWSLKAAGEPQPVPAPAGWGVVEARDGERSADQCPRARVRAGGARAAPPRGRGGAVPGPA